jgi:hypothetical protein
MGTEMSLIWIDIDNLPHIPIFQPLISELEEAGHEILITVRDFAYSVEKLEDSGLKFHVIGRHYGKATVSKVAGTLLRAGQLRRFLRNYPVDLAVSHSSRSAILAGWSRRIPTVAMFDYEHVSTTLQENFATHILVPELLLQPGTTLSSSKYQGYPGYKEEIYLADFVPDRDFRQQLQIPPDSIFAVLRPPATEAHYHNPEAETIFQAILERLDSEGLFTLITPRSAAQAAEFRHLSEERFRVLTRPVDGLNLISAADFVISGGGTMNREAALLGTPVYSFFRGKPGSLDRNLAASGKLVFISSRDEVSQIPCQRKQLTQLQPVGLEVKKFVSRFLIELVQ